LFQATLTNVQAFLSVEKKNLRNNPIILHMRNENGFSLLEISIAIALMGILMVVTPLAVNEQIQRAQANTVKSDLSAVMTELSGFHLLNPDRAPDAQEFQTMLYAVLSDYTKTPALLQEHLGYLNSFSIWKDRNYYCVFAERTYGTNTHRYYYDALAGDIYEAEPTQECPQVLGRAPVMAD
jgi:prepilin-type N-terminal cleavage/methylation domain-containing protein